MVLVKLSPLWQQESCHSYILRTSLCVWHMECAKYSLVNECMGEVHRKISPLQEKNALFF